MGEDLSLYRSDRATVVADLLLAPGVWDTTLLSHLFPTHIVQKIQALPLSPQNHADRWIWDADRKGRFTVKSAYHIARCRILEEEPSNPNPSAVLWKQLWNAPVPGNVKVAHIPNLPGASCVADWLVSIYSQAPAVFAPSLMTIWATWRNRNSRIWDEECKLAIDIVPITLGWWEDYKAARTPSPSVHRSGSLTQWKKPPIGFIKLNVDAAFCLDSGITGLGGVFRDHEGVVLGGF
ncbi:uncharacterized protein LOC112194559 [Rosa chinensis]|uniref:uncharacterized protein LOC112194559 n=1 Tax=Rosa chinensis TaxID=74649 RepID=UPI000D088473|nr:uncharacterized protein LOC112194559 [Rosa chinensis]